MEEIWKDIEGFKNYQVSSLGNVRRLDGYIKHNKGGLKKWQGKILKPVLRNTGYYFVSLCENGKRKDFPLHKLVATAFIPNPNNYPCIDHIDTIRTNNAVTNLRWVTHKMNQNNPITLVNMSKSQINDPNRSKKINQYTTDGVLVKCWPSLMEIGRVLNYSCNSISKCCSKKPHYNTAYGYKWEFAS